MSRFKGFMDEMCGKDHSKDKKKKKEKMDEGKETSFLKKLGNVSDELGKLITQGSKMVDTANLKKAQTMINDVVFNAGKKVHK